tara:strand:- start:6400 stop:6609 length:210 start_codon:yes stop_codon:yes gene_type:complete
LTSKQLKTDIMYLQNFKKLVDLITKQIGWTISNRECAKDLLSFYPECDYKELKKVDFTEKGILNAKLIF